MSVMGEITLSLAHFESLFVTIKLNGRSIVVGCIYRSPSSCIGDFLSTLNNVLGEVSNVGLSNVVIGGDINVDLLKGSSVANGLSDIFSCFSYHQVICRPTRVTSSTASLLDQIWTTADIDRIKAGVIKSFTTDHFPIFIRIKYNLRGFSSSARVDVERRNYNNESSQGLLSRRLSQA